MANYDMDEFFLPKHLNIYDVQHMLAYLESQYPETIGFLFGEDFYPMWAIKRM